MKNSIRLLCVLLPILALLAGCGRERESADSHPIAESNIPRYVEGEELLRFCETEEEASTIAEQYGIELVSYCDGVAVFHTEEEPEEVISRGKEQGWPELSLNGIVHALQ